jgi:transcriptional regulator with GAF, ATPase, and Fis domain
MYPLLVVLEGELAGKKFELADGPVRIGRGESNTVALRNENASRDHCVIEREGTAFVLRDIGSTNGTRVNGVLVSEATLTHGDFIVIPAMKGIFLEVENPIESSFSFVDEQDTIATSHDTVYLDVDACDSWRSKSADVISKIVEDIISVRDPVALQHKVLEKLLGVVPGERGVILLLGERGDRFLSTVCSIKGAGPGGHVRISRTVVNKSLREGRAILTTDVLGGQPTQSQVELGIRSVLSVPLKVLKKTIGVLYIDSSDPHFRFDQPHLELTVVISRIAAIAIEHARYLDFLEKEREYLKQESRLERSMVGNSPFILEAYRRVERIAPTDEPVLIRGETGTGKTLVALDIRDKSRRSGRTFLDVNCATIQKETAESELFGHVKGAFTGADFDKVGIFEAANGGTLFLDEIGELSMEVQAKLLLVLENRPFMRKGGVRPIQVDVRLIFATNRPVEEMIRQGKFHADLFERIKGFTIALPPLRERAADIPVLANHFLQKYLKKLGRQTGGFTPRAMSLLQTYDWPGNVRELEQSIRYALIMSNGDRIAPEDLPDLLQAHPVPDKPDLSKLDDAIAVCQNETILRAFDCAHTFGEAARILGRHPNYLFRLVKRLGLREELEKRGFRYQRPMS